MANQQIINILHELVKEFNYEPTLPATRLTSTAKELLHSFNKNLQLLAVNGLDIDADIEYFIDESGHWMSPHATVN